MKTGGRTAQLRRPDWRIRVRRGISFIMLTSLALACAPAAPPAATSAPAPAAAAKPVEASPQAAPAKPAAAAQPAASPVVAAGPAKGSITIVNESEPNTLVPKDVSSYLAYVVMNNLYDSLTACDLSSGTPKVVGYLAESFSPVNPNTWRFKLRQGIKFTNGEPFNADAVVAVVTNLADPQKPGLGTPEYGTLQSAAKVDDFTADITTKDPDPILPERLINFPIPAPNWVKTASPEVLATQAVGTGPYMLADYQKGNYMLLKANPDYWGPIKPKIAEIKYVGRPEQAVRGAMLQAGEADLVFQITAEQAKVAPQKLYEDPQDGIAIRINHEHPVMQDVRVRQAIVEAVDTQGIINSLFPGVGNQLNGQVIRQGTVGWNPNLKPYPYKPDEAKRLLEEAGAVGTPLEYVNRPGLHPQAGEVGELVVNQLNQVGFKATIRNLDAVAAVEAQRAVKPGQKRTDLHLISVSYRILDSTKMWDTYYACGASSAIGCDEEWERGYTEAKGLTGEARDKAFQGLWERLSTQYRYLPLFALSRVYGASAQLQWTPRLDGRVLFVEMSLKP
jgi:peptide/nickel transport system substrate-binding protein